MDSNLIIGKITYLNTKNKVPITLLGTIEDNKNYKLLEFDSTGNITGIIEGKPTESVFKGLWVSPNTKKNFNNTFLKRYVNELSQYIKPNNNDIFSNYHYNYGDKGLNDHFDIYKIGNNKIDFSIISLINVERGSNIAEVEKDTITRKGNSFIYKIPDSYSCEIIAIFYKKFV